MGTTYCANSDLVLDSGRSLDVYLDVSLSDEQKEIQKNKARERAYNFINATYLMGMTVIPAFHIPGLKQVEIDLVITALMTDSFSMETANISEWTEKYKERAEKSLDNLKFVSSSEIAVAGEENVGNGTVSTIVTKDSFTRTEVWVLEATDVNSFLVCGSLHEYLVDLEVGIKYPEHDWTRSLSDYGLILSDELRFDEFPISLLITAGSIPFEKYDRFTFKTYAASHYRKREGKLMRG